MLGAARVERKDTGVGQVFIHRAWHGWQGTDWPDRYAAWRDQNACLYARWYGGDSQSYDAGIGAPDRSRYFAGQHLSSDVAPHG